MKSFKDHLQEHNTFKAVIEVDKMEYTLLFDDAVNDKNVRKLVREWVRDNFIGTPRVKIKYILTPTEYTPIWESAPPPEDWDLKVFDKSFKKQLDYATEKASKLGTGSSRVVFEISFEGRTTVLKIAKNAKGLAQNNKEADYGLYRMYPSITCPMIDYDKEHDDPKWIHVEKAEKLTKSKFKAIEGFAFEDFYYMLRDDEDARNGKKGRNFQINWEARVDAEEREKIWESELFGDVTDLMANFDILAGDLGRTANWGIYKGNPVIIDLGFDSHVNAQYYKRKR